MLKIKRNISGMTMIEILISTMIGVVLLGLVYLAYRNIYSLSQIQNLETEFKQSSGTVMQNMTSNIQNSYKTGASFFVDPNFILVSPIVERKIYNTTDLTAGDTFGVYLASETAMVGTDLSKTFIRYGLRKFPDAPGNFKGYAIYREEIGGLINYTSPPAADPNFSLSNNNFKIILGYYKNPHNYLAVSKLAFKPQGKSVVNIYMQLVGCVSRGGGSASNAIYRPTDSTFYTTSVQMKVESGEN